MGGERALPQSPNTATPSMPTTNTEDQANPDDIQEDTPNIATSSHRCSNPSTRTSAWSSLGTIGSATNYLKLVRTAIQFTKRSIPAVNALAICGFPLLILSTWAAIAAIRVALWTQWKDSIEWCENHNWSYPGCDALKEHPLTLPGNPPPFRRYNSALNVPRSNPDCFCDGGEQHATTQAVQAVQTVIENSGYICIVVVLLCGLTIVPLVADKFVDLLTMTRPAFSKPRNAE